MSAAPRRERRARWRRLARRRGSCRDFATLMMEAARALGFAARFVSGYLYVPDRDTGEHYLGGGSTHAWCQIYLPGSGWVEFDPTNGIVGNRDLIRVAVAREAQQAIPLHGCYFGDAAIESEMDVSVHVRRLPPGGFLAAPRPGAEASGNLRARQRCAKLASAPSHGLRRRRDEVAKC